MIYTPARRDTLLVPSGPEGDHLFLVTTDACQLGKHLLANFCSVRPGRVIDPTCLVQAGEHPFIRHESFVLYRSARLEPAQKIAVMVNGWAWKQSHQASEALTNRILDGFHDSPFTPKYIKDYLAG